MIFGRLPIDEAEGAILAHAVDSNPGKKLRKGHILTADDISGLKANSVETVLAAKLETNDIDENQAAGDIAAPLAGQNVKVNPAFTGRANIVSKNMGIARINTDLINKVNHLHESITIATVNDYDVVEEDTLLATIKIIPFAVDKKDLANTLEVIAEASEPIVSVSEFQKLKVGVVSTLLAGTKEKVVKKSEQILQNRLQLYHNDIDVRMETDHHEVPLSDSFTKLLAEGCELILVFGASAITDRGDVVPMAIRMAGGEVDHFGMPVDPGNLLLLGHKDSVPIVGLPGCTRSPKLNGFDWVLQRLLAKLTVTPSDIMDMGTGGLLKEISSRPQPRTKSSKSKKNQNGKSIAILILAAGQSRRMGPENKLLAEIEGKPMFSLVAEQALKSNAIDVFAITGHEQEQVEEVATKFGIKTFHNPDYKTGLSSSLKTGFRELADTYEGLVICLADMPFITATLFNEMIEAFDAEEGRAIIVPAFNGKRGNPVLIGSQFKPDILAVTGDIGAKSVIADNEHVVFTIDVHNDSIFKDIDTPEALSLIQAAKDAEE